MIWADTENENTHKMFIRKHNNGIGLVDCRKYCLHFHGACISYYNFSWKTSKVET